MDYPHQGDDGSTGYLGTGRLKKSDLRIETLGTIDEATAALGMVRATTDLDEIKAVVLEIQRDLYHIMAETAAEKANAEKFRKVEESRVDWLEEKILTFGKETQIGKNFIIPGDNFAGAATDMARTVVRRAERRLVELADRGDIENPHLIRYMNRLSTLLFILEQIEYAASGKPTTTIVKGK